MLSTKPPIPAPHKMSYELAPNGSLKQPHSLPDRISLRWDSDQHRSPHCGVVCILLE